MEYLIKNCKNIKILNLKKVRRSGIIKMVSISELNLWKEKIYKIEILWLELYV